MQKRSNRSWRQKREGYNYYVRKGQEYMLRHPNKNTPEKEKEKE